MWNIFCAILKRLSLFSFSLVSALVCNFFATRSFMYMVCSKFLFKAESRFKQVYIGKIFSFLFLCLKDSFYNRYKLLSARCISGLYTLLYLILVEVIFHFLSFSTPKWLNNEWPLPPHFIYDFWPKSVIKSLHFPRKNHYQSVNPPKTIKRYRIVNWYSFNEKINIKFSKI